MAIICQVEPFHLATETVDSPPPLRVQSEVNRGGDGGGREIGGSGGRGRGEGGSGGIGGGPGGAVGVDGDHIIKVMGVGREVGDGEGGGAGGEHGGGVDPGGAGPGFEIDASRGAVERPGDFDGGGGEGRSDDGGGCGGKRQWKCGGRGIGVGPGRAGTVKGDDVVGVAGIGGEAGVGVGGGAGGELGEVDPGGAVPAFDVDGGVEVVVEGPGDRGRKWRKVEWRERSPRWGRRGQLARAVTTTPNGLLTPETREALTVAPDVGVCA